MTRILLLSSEAIRPRMAGIGIRYLELAQRLAADGLDVVLASPAAAPESAGMLPPSVERRRFEPQRLAELTAGCDAAVAQGQLANDLLLAAPALPVAIDLYDPWLVENLSYLDALGLDPYRNDHATWLLQMSRGDFFLCSSEEQRVFYLGFLAALGRVNPELVARDPDLRTLIDVVPFGVAAELPPHRPYLPPPRWMSPAFPQHSPELAGAPGLPEPENGPRTPAPPGAMRQRRLLFGGLYDWYDPWTLLDALAALDRPDWLLLLIRNPNAGTPQRLFAAVEERCRRLGWWGSRVEALDWVPAERRHDLLRDVDVLVAPHRPSLETRLALRTRFLDALAAGCPVVTSEGGAMSQLLRQHRAGWVVAAGDARALGEALLEVLDGAAPGGGAALPAGGSGEREGSGARGVASGLAQVAVTAAERTGTSETLEGPLAAVWRQGAAELLAAFRWERAIAPLLAFCRAPRRDATKERFVHSLATAAPADGSGFRVRRRLRRLLAALTGGVPGAPGAAGSGS
jgi:glycosyltransferase involved in cell wall biosynthesis